MKKSKAKKGSYAWVEKATVAAAIVTLILMGAHRSLADDNLYNVYGSTQHKVERAPSQSLRPPPTTSENVVQNAPLAKKIAKKAPAKKAAKKKKKIANRVVPVPLVNPEVQKAKLIAKKRAVHSSIDSEIQDMTSDMKNEPLESTTQQNATQKAAALPVPMSRQNLIAQNDDLKSSPPRRQGLKYLKVAGPKDTYALATPPAANNNIGILPDTNGGSTITKIETPKADEPAPYSGGVNFTFGRDTNIDPNKTGMQSAFYAIEPTLGYKSGGFSASFSGSMKDFTKQEVSDTNKTNEAKVDVGYEAALSDTVKETTAIEGVYHNEMWPNDVTGPDINGYDHGLGVLYYDAKLTETVAFDFGGMLKTEIGGFFMHRENTNYQSDYAADILDPLFTTQSFNEYNGFAKIALEAGDYVEFALRPVIDDKQFTERHSRQPDGSQGGNVIGAPLAHLLASEINFDINFKFLGTKIGPTAVIGQTSDESLGGENNSYYGAGLKGDILLVPDWKFTVSPSVMYKHIAYDNWNNSGTGNTNRVDDDMEVAVNGKVMFTKNFGWGVGYANSHYTSSWQYTGVNFNEEILSTTAMFSF